MPRHKRSAWLTPVAIIAAGLLVAGAIVGPWAFDKYARWSRAKAMERERREFHDSWFEHPEEVQKGFDNQLAEIRSIKAEWLRMNSGQTPPGIPPGTWEDLRSRYPGREKELRIPPGK